MDDKAEVAWVDYQAAADASASFGREPSGKETVTAGYAARDAEKPPMPWERPELAGWVIVGMNHYHMEGERRLFVAMTRGRQCAQAEGADEPGVWESLAREAAACGEAS